MWVDAQCAHMANYRRFFASSISSEPRAAHFRPQHDTTQPFYGPFFRENPGEPVPEENFWTLWCKGRLREADILNIRLDAAPSGLTSAHIHHPPIFTGRMPFLLPNQQCQSTEGN